MDSAIVRVTGLPAGGRGTGTGGPAGWAAAAGTTAVTACTGLIMPAPVCAPVGPSAVASIRRTTWAAVSRGWAARTSAATPDTNAAAKLVPWLAGL